VVLISEILTGKGVKLVGPLPRKFQDYVAFSTGISAGSRNTEAAQVLLKFIAGPIVAPTFKAKRIEPSK
jgi:molybdate transport system substrate-binding protein